MITKTDWIKEADTIGAELAQMVDQGDNSGVLVRESVERLRASGLAAALVPHELGGGGATHAEMGDVLRTLGRHDPATALTFSMHVHPLALQLWRHRHGMDASAVFGKVVGGALLTSTGGSDWVSSNGSSRRVDGGYRVSARKAPVSGCEVGDVMVTSFRYDDPTAGAQVLHCSIPLTADGVRIEETWDTLGMRATGSHTVVLDDVFVPEAAVSVVRTADVWHPVWNAVVGAAIPLIMSVYLGVADRAIEITQKALMHKREPHVFQMLGEMLNEHLSASDAIAAMYVDADDLRFDNTDALASRTLARKSVAADALISVVRLGLEAVGGSAFMRSSEMQRLYRDVHGCLYHPLPIARQTQFSGRVMLGLAPI